MTYAWPSAQKNQELDEIAEWLQECDNGRCSHYHVIVDVRSGNRYGCHCNMELEDFLLLFPEVRER